MGQRPVHSPPDLRYDDVSFGLCRGRAYFVLVAEDGAITLRGVAIGDDLGEARKAYSALVCGRAYGGESLFGGGTYYPYCAGRLGAHRWISFGEDPIASITIARTRVGGTLG